MFPSNDSHQTYFIHALRQQSSLSLSYCRMWSSYRLGQVHAHITVQFNGTSTLRRVFFLSWGAVENNREIFRDFYVRKWSKIIDMFHEQARSEDSRGLEV